MTVDYEDIEDMINSCESMLGQDMFNRWEEEFIESIRDHYEDDGGITQAQREKLEELYEKI